jgi:hypothetical protein
MDIYDEVAGRRQTALGWKLWLLGRKITECREFMAIPVS